MVKVGDKLEEFALKNHLGEDFDSEELSGKCLLLSFHPLAWTEVCGAQMKALDDNMDFFRSFGVVPLGISVDAHTAKKPWADHLGLKELQLLSDFWPHGGLAAKLGNFIEEMGISGRANILVDRDGNGTVVWVRTYDIPELPDIDEVKEAVRARCSEGCCQ